MDTFVDTRSDFGFKLLMENNKFILGFLNAFLPVQVNEVTSVEEASKSLPSTPTQVPHPAAVRATSLPRERVVFESNELNGNLPTDKSIRYDIVCVTSKNEYVNVEMQVSTQAYYFHRAVFYTSRLVSRQGWRGTSERTPFEHVSGTLVERKPHHWNWRLYPTYHIGLVEFELDRIIDLPNPVHNCWKIWSRLAIDGPSCAPALDETIIHTKTVNICIVSLPAFRRLAKPKDLAERFLWLIAYCGASVPEPDWIQHNDLFKDACSRLKISNLGKLKTEEYEQSVKQMRDEGDRYLTALEEGREKTLREAYERALQRDPEITKEDLYETLCMYFEESAVEKLLNK